MGRNYIYQTIHTLSHTALFVAEHCRILESSYMDIFMRPLMLDYNRVKGDIESLLRSSKAASEVSVFVELRVDCDGNIDTSISDVSYYSGYALRSIAPTGVALSFQSPFGLHRSSARREALSFAGDVARSHGGDVAIECDEVKVASGAIFKRVIAIDGAAAFGVVGRKIIASTTMAKVGSVERKIAIDVARERGFKVEERDLLLQELEELDELFYCDHWGITALSSFSHLGKRRRYANIISESIAGHLSQPWW